MEVPHLHGCVTVLPEVLVGKLREHLKRVREVHEEDRKLGLPCVAIPGALERKFSKAGSSWAWFWLFPAPECSVDPESGVTWRHHVHPGCYTNALARALKEAGITKRVTSHCLRHAVDSVAASRLPHPCGAALAAVCLLGLRPPPGCHANDSGAPPAPSPFGLRFAASKTLPALGVFTGKRQGQMPLRRIRSSRPAGSLRAGCLRPPPRGPRLHHSGTARSRGCALDADLHACRPRGGSYGSQKPAGCGVSSAHLVMTTRPPELPHRCALSRRQIVNPPASF
jgi:hypothetical protein